MGWVVHKADNVGIDKVCGDERNGFPCCIRNASEAGGGIREVGDALIDFQKCGEVMGGDSVSDDVGFVPVKDTGLCLGAYNGWEGHVGGFVFACLKDDGGVESYALGRFDAFVWEVAACLYDTEPAEP